MVTRGDAVSSARNAVFNTNELLESIVIKLQPKTILTMRRVNKHLNEMVTGSPKIQRKLFLLPEEEQTWVCEVGGKVLRNATKGGGDEAGIEWTIPAQLNDMLFTLQPQARRETLYKRMKLCEPVNLVSRPSLAKRKSVYHKMFLSQPPAKEVEVELFYAKRTGTGKFRYFGDAEVRMTVASQDGVKWGDVVKAFKVQVGPGTKEDPVEGYLIKLGPSTLWMGGVVFPTDEETAVVKIVES